MNRLTLTPDRLGLLDGATPFVWRGTLDWQAYGVLLNRGAAAFTTLLRDRKSVGANTVCCGLRLSWVPGLHAANPGFWSNLIPAARMAAAEGLRLCFVVFADTAMDLGDGLHDPAAWQPHLDRLLTHLGLEPNVSFVYANQPGNGPQANLTADRVRAFVKPSGFEWMLAARDNPNESANPIVPVADLGLYCPSRNVSKFFNIGASMAQIVNGWPDDLAAWSGTHTASILFESWHAKPGEPSCDPGLWRQIARSLAFKGVCGGNFYSEQLAQGALTLSGQERDCAVEFLGNIPTP